MTVPAVSVVMPNFNKERFIAAAIESVLSQSLMDLELIVVDDCSTDASSARIEGFSRDPRMRLIRHPRRKGPGAARNSGIKSASGRLIALLDSDDMFAPDWLKGGVEVLEAEPAPCVAYGDWWLVNARGERLPRKRTHMSKSGRVFADLLCRNLEVNTAIMAPKLCFEEAGFYDETILWGEDYDMVLRLARKFPFLYFAEEAYGYRLHAGNSWKQFSTKTMYRRKADVLRRHLAEGGELLTPAQRSVVEGRLATYLDRSGQHLRLFISALLANLGSGRHLPDWV